jgi:SAM-dependent methyltransferase
MLRKLRSLGGRLRAHQDPSLAPPEQTPPAAPQPALAHHLDPFEAHVEGLFTPISGWVAHPAGVRRVEARSGATVVPAVLGVARPGAGAPGGASPAGFYLEAGSGANGTWELWAETGEGEVLRLAEVAAGVDDRVFKAVQPRVLERLACPSCKARIPAHTPACPACGRGVTWLGDDVPSFLGEPSNPMMRGEPVSRHPALRDVGAQHLDLDGGGLFLDAGAGWPPVSHEAMVELEVERYPSTNVVADAHELPFVDGAFDGVMSHAVMEHVQDPERYSLELLRVVRPGGVFVVHSAFLQPVHAYPHHYFNTTLEGLRHLFRSATIHEAGVAPFQQPWVALDWILQVYAAGLHESERERFLDQRIRDLVTAGEQRPLASFTQLRPETIEELAAGVYVVGER